MLTLLLSTSLLVSPIQEQQLAKTDPYPSIEKLLNSNMSLSPSERDRIFREAEFAAMKAMRSMEKARICFEKITNRSYRELCKDAITGGIASFPGATYKEKVVAAVVAIVSRIAMDACDDFWDGIDHLADAQDYARYCDYCQERLWRDE